MSEAQIKNIDEELNNEGFFALVLAYNDKISGRGKREFVRKHVEGLDKDKFSFYALTDKEKAGLEIARKSDKGGEFSEDDVVKIFSSFCCSEVCEVLNSDLSHGNKANLLHSIILNRTLANENLNSFVIYDKINDYGKKAAGYKSRYTRTCGILNAIEKLRQSEEFKKASNEKKQELDATKKQLGEISLQEGFTQSLYDMSASLARDCFTSLNQLDDASLVGTFASA